MSSQTPNLNLVLPIGTEKVSRQIINDNNTKIDTAVGSNSTAIAKVQNGLAYIVGNTNTTGGTLAVGQFVYVKGHSTIAEGLRTVTASISANGNITTSNTSACSEGGLNALNSKYVFRTKPSGQQTMAANAVYSIVPETVAGYSVIGVVSFSNGGSDVVTVMDALASGVKFKNIGSSTVYPAMSATFMYQKN